MKEYQITGQLILDDDEDLDSLTRERLMESLNFEQVSEEVQ